MRIVDVHEAITELPRLLAAAEDGEELVIARTGHPIARLVPIASSGARVLGRDRGAFVVPDDFDDPLPADVLVGSLR